MNVFSLIDFVRRQAALSPNPDFAAAVNTPIAAPDLAPVN
jgi:hypothetical protein